jgi:hypothetical protein
MFNVCFVLLRCCQTHIQPCLMVKKLSNSVLKFTAMLTLAFVVVLLAIGGWMHVTN